jgi:hypothetical protein
MIAPVYEQYMKIYKTTRLHAGSFLGGEKNVRLFKLLLPFIIIPAYEHEMKFIEVSASVKSG